MKKLLERIITMSIVITLFLQAAAPAFAVNEPEIYYATENCFSYYLPDVSNERMLYPIGKNERILVEYVHEKNFGKEGETYCVSKYNGVETFIPCEFLTSEKPEITYTVKDCLLTLSLSGPVAIHEEPIKNSDFAFYDKKDIMTIGQTNYWYKVFVNGAVGFIRKNEENITSAEPSYYPYFSARFADDKYSEINSIPSRLLYSYSMLPYNVRKLMEEKKVSITATDVLSVFQYENGNNSGFIETEPYGRYIIELKDTESCVYNLEFAFFHEVGHLISFEYGMVPYNAFYEYKTLAFHNYYQNLTEYSAEIFNLYIKRNEYLKEKAPLSYMYVTTHLENIHG